MSLLRVRLVGEDVLQTAAEAVRDIGPLDRMIRDMLETISVDSRAVALAAPQVGSLTRVFVFQDNGRPMVFINPEIMEKSDEVVTVGEGCLSIPDYFAPVTRPEKVSGKALDWNGNEWEFDADGLLARAIQHEQDHLNGVLMFSRMDPVDLQKLLDGMPPELHRLRKGIRRAVSRQA